MKLDWKGLRGQQLWADLVLLWLQVTLVIQLLMIHGVPAMDSTAAAAASSSQQPSSNLQGELSRWLGARAAADNEPTCLYGCTGVGYYSSPRLRDSSTRRQTRAATSVEVYLWPNATVPYYIDNLGKQRHTHTHSHTLTHSLTHTHTHTHLKWFTVYQNVLCCCPI